MNECEGGISASSIMVSGYEARALGYLAGHVHAQVDFEQPSPGVLALDTKYHRHLRVEVRAAARFCRTRSKRNHGHQKLMSE